MQFKFIISYVLIILILLALLNIYPPTVIRNLAFTTTKTTMASQLSVISSSLSGLDILTERGVSQIMESSPVTGLSRILVTDPSGMVIFDDDITDPGTGKFLLIPEVVSALHGKDVFHSTYNGNVFESKATVPIVRSGKTIGAVCIFENDTERALNISRVQSNLLRISGVFFVASILIGIFFSRLLTGKIKNVLGAIQKLRAGEYGFRMQIIGHDEISKLGNEFNELSERLKTTDEMRRRFVSDASHELKTPLAAIRLLSDSIVQNSEIDQSTMKEFVSDIGEEAERLTRTTEKLLTLTRLDSGVASKPYPVHVADVASRVVHMLEPLAEKSSVTLSSSFTEGCYVMITEDELYTIIFNLAENAVKYNLPNGTVKIMVYKYNDLVRIVVDDTGVGIPEEDLGNIFDRFYRVDKARSREAGGSGLGLSIVKDTVVHYGGTIEVFRREPGTRFRVCFPSAEGGEPGI